MKTPKTISQIPPLNTFKGSSLTRQSRRRISKSNPTWATRDKREGLVEIWGTRKASCRYPHCQGSLGFRWRSQYPQTVCTTPRSQGPVTPSPSGGRGCDARLGQEREIARVRGIGTVLVEENVHHETHPDVRPKVQRCREPRQRDASNTEHFKCSRTKTRRRSVASSEAPAHMLSWRVFVAVCSDGPRYGCLIILVEI